MQDRSSKTLNQPTVLNSVQFDSDIVLGFYVTIVKIIGIKDISPYFDTRLVSLENSKLAGQILRYPYKD